MIGSIGYGDSYDPGIVWQERNVCPTNSIKKHGKPQEDTSAPKKIKIDAAEEEREAFIQHFMNVYKDSRDIAERRYDAFA